MKQSKEDVRKTMKNRLSAVSAAQAAAWSDAVCARLLVLPQYQRASRFMAFLNMKGEVSLDAFLIQALREGKEVYVPHCVDNGQMEAVQLTSLQDVEQGMYGIRVPKAGSHCIAPEQLEWILVPGLAFDAEGHRLGRGAGFYDRYLQRAQQAAVTAVAWDIQIIPHVPTEAHDYRVPAVLTPTRYIVQLHM